MKNNNLLEIPIENQSKAIILEKIEKYIEHPRGFFHIVSLNPENLVITHQIDRFKEVVKTAQMRIVDGVGIVLAAQILLGLKLTRVPGVDLMDDIIKMAAGRSAPVVLIGGRDNLAQELAECYRQQLPQIKIQGIRGFNEVRRPKKAEIDEIFSIVAAVRPSFVFVAFGSPQQEIWLSDNKDKLEGIVCMGVGGAFDFLSGKVSRAPRFVRTIGMEWLYRLVHQPWRWKRQLRLVQFIWLVVQQRFTSS